MTEHTTNGIGILDSTVRTAGTVMPAPRLSSYRGKRVGLLDNSKEKAEPFLATLGQVIHRRKPSYSRIAPLAIFDALRQTCDWVITAMGA